MVYEDIIIPLATNKPDSIYHNNLKDGGISILPLSFAKGKLYMFKNTQKINILGHQT